MKKVLVGFLIDGKSGGIDHYLMNFLQSVAQPELQIDFLTNRIDEALQQRLKEYGSELYEIPSLAHPIRQYRAIKALIRRNHYDITYFNISTAIHLMGPMAAYHCGVKKRILHSHSSGVDGENKMKRKMFTLLHRLCKGKLSRCGTDFLACSQKAGEWLYSRRVLSSGRLEIIFNAVDLDRFHYSETIRREVRNELGICSPLVVGHVGSFSYVKNHTFLLKVFARLSEQEPDALLMLAGNGVRWDAVRQEAQELGIEDKILYLGYRSDVDRLFQAIDFFVMPSYFEGYPVVCVEAQAERLCCVLSDTITKEAALTKECYFLSLKDGPDSWADFIIEHRGYDRNQNQMIRETDFCGLEAQKKSYQKILELE